MTLFIIYLLKVNAVISVLILFYIFLLRNERFFKLNRIVLLGIIFSSFILPFTPAFNFFNIDQIDTHATTVTPFVKIYNSIGESQQSFSTAYKSIAAYPLSARWVNPLNIFFVVYLFFVFVLLFRFSFQLSSLIPVIRQSKKYQKQNIIYCQHDQKIGPFSFFHYLVINASLYDQQQSDQIIEHEIAHIRQFHFIDILLSELTQIILWINPLTILLKRYLKLNLEFIADETVLNKGTDKQKYQLNLLKISLNSSRFPLTVFFNSSKLKLRIKMMNSKKAPAYHLFKYAFLLPLFVVVYFIINPLSVQTLKAQVQKQIRPSQLDSIIAKCLDAMGGKEQLGAIKTIYIESKVSVSNGMTGISVYDIEYNNRYRHETTIGDQKVVVCESESKGWKMNPRDRSGIELTGKEISEYKPELYLGGYLFNYALLGNKIEYIGKEGAGSNEEYKIKVITKDSSEVTYFINANSYKLEKEVRIYASNGEIRKKIFNYSDFRKTDEGYIMPFSTAMTNSQDITVSYSVIKISINRKFDKKMFDKPE